MAYKSNYLSVVIARIDFLNEEDSFFSTINDDLLKEIRKVYKIEDPKEAITKTITENSGNLTQVEDKRIQWNFFDISRSKRLCLTSKEIFVEFKEYTDFDDFMRYFLSIIMKLFELYPNLKARRIGLRYVDEIELKTELYDFDGYINNNLIKSFGFEGENTLLRNMSVINMMKDDILITFQYGISNPDFPAKIKRNIFVLDTDVAYTGIISGNEVKDYLYKFHKIVKEVFEKAIEDKLRKQMENED